MFTASLFKLHEIHSTDPLLVLPFVSIIMSLEMDWINRGIVNYSESSLQKITAK